MRVLPYPCVPVDNSRALAMSLSADSPGIRYGEAVTEWITRVPPDVVAAGDPGATRDAGHNRRIRADRRCVDDAADEMGRQDALVDVVGADLQLTPPCQDGQPRASRRAASGTVEPARADDSCVAPIPSCARRRDE